MVSKVTYNSNSNTSKNNEIPTSFHVEFYLHFIEIVEHRFIHVIHVSNENKRYWKHGNF